MNILFDKEILQNLRECFPQSFVNMDLEFICYPKKNTYFKLEDVSTPLVLKCKILEYLSREADKSPDKKSKEYHFHGINKFLGTNFTDDDMKLIYTYLGNGVNRRKTIDFINSGYDIKVLKLEVE